MLLLRTSMLERSSDVALPVDAEAAKPTAPSAAKALGAIDDGANPHGNVIACISEPFQPDRS